MLQIRRNSWHYKLAMFCDPKKAPTDLCSYVRCMIGSSLLMVCLTALAGGAAVWLVAIILGLLFNPILTGIGYYLVGPNALCMDFLLSVLSAKPRVCEDPSTYTFFTPLIIISFVVWIAGLTFWLFPPAKKSLAKIETLQLAGAYISAKKRKICPTIEYV